MLHNVQTNIYFCFKVLVEEAAHVLEPVLVSCLNEFTEHLVLVLRLRGGGDIEMGQVPAGTDTPAETVTLAGINTTQNFA